MASTDKDLDLVLFGATGFTGQLVAEYLAKKRPALRWALAGRSREKLERVRDGLAALDPATRDLPILVGDGLDPAAVDAIARRARVVCTTVGPFARYGSALVGACAEHGTAYCDITGEAPWIRTMIDAHHARAVATGARIVHCCGFDSIPSDLGVLLLHEHLAAQGKRLGEVHFRVVKIKGGPSGGTIATMLDMMENAGDPAVRRALGDPYALDPDGSSRGPDQRDAMGPRRDADTGRWAAPFVMAAINTRVVRRSNALAEHAYGRDFRYDEGVDTGRGARGFAGALGMSAAIVGGLAAVAFPPARRLAMRFLPAPGQGPSRAEREAGGFRIELRATTTGGEKLVGVVEGVNDPGYGETSKMLGESALCLAEDPLPARGGILTPATAMGMKLVDRLRAAGMTFRVA
jgi:short subunit dehydrogenase-like uncharacterized protein